MFNFKQYDFKRYNIALLVVVFIIGCIGTYLIYQVQPSDWKRQLVGIIGGIIIAVVVSIFDYHFVCSFYVILYIINMILLVMVRLVGEEKYHARRWLNLGFMEFQPSELSKIILIICIAKIFSMFREKINKAWVLLLSVVMVAVPTFLILIQTNLSTSLVIAFIFIMMVYAAGLSWKIILPIIVIGVPVVVGLFWYVQQDYQVLLQPYQQDRVVSFLHPEQYPDLQFQQKNSVTAIGSGQLYGKVLNDSAGSARNYDKIPVSESDFIFSVAGEEFGFIGGLVIIILYAVIIYICITTARRAPDYMGMLLAIGMASLFSFQLFVNIGVTTKILPNTGIPLPFLSAGLSSAIAGAIAIGMIINIRLQPQRTRGMGKSL
jgi:Bacterial cell division membrane protein